MGSTANAAVGSVEAEGLIVSEFTKKLILDTASGYININDARTIIKNRIQGRRDNEQEESR